MAANGYITVSVDYDDIGASYVNGCNRPGREPRGFVAKSRAIFDINLPNSVANQVCNSDDTVPVDCTMGIATAGYSQGGHISVLARNYNPLVTGNLVLAHGNVNTANGGAFDVSCVNSDQLDLPKERRRSIVGENDQFFGRNYDGVLVQVSPLYTIFSQGVPEPSIRSLFTTNFPPFTQQMATSGYDQETGRCPLQCFDGSTTNCNCLHLLPEGCNYSTPETPNLFEQQCTIESSPNFLRLYNGLCPQCNEVSSCGLPLFLSACPFEPDDPQQTAGFYIIREEVDFPADHYFLYYPQFRELRRAWGAPQNFYWLAQVARN